jgi:serine/threonine-protein kinase
MEYLDGAPLSAHIHRWRALPLGTLARLLSQMLDALGAAHAKGIVHRDLKPDNVYVTATGRVKILDFGIAKLRPEQGGVSAETRTGSLMGTPQYMSPEQAQGISADHRADLYSAGVILFEGATGQRPFPAQTLYELLKAHVELMPPAPSLLRPDIPPSLENVLLHALQKDPAYRYQSAADFKAALEQAVQYLPAEAHVPLGEGNAPLGSSHASSHGPQPSPSPYASPTPGASMSPYATPAHTPFHAAMPTPHPMQHGSAYPHHMMAPPPPRNTANTVWIVLACVALAFIAFFLTFCGSCLGALSS